MGQRSPLWSRPGLWAVVGSHTLADFYIGAVGALLPFLVTKAGYSYAEIAGLSLAMTSAASISQPGFGFLADKYRLRWALPACIAGTGLCMSLSTARPDNYAMVWVLIALAGFASAAYHPPATMIVRDIAPGSNVVMSVFAAAGNLGVALGPLAVVAVVGPWGLGATSWLILPGVAGLALYALASRFDEVLRQRVDRSGPPSTKPQLQRPHGDLVVEVLDDAPPAETEGRDRWHLFGLLMASMTVWQLCFIAANTFVAVYMIDEFGVSESASSLPLTLLPAFGAVGTLLGGWMGDRVGRLSTIRIGYTFALAGALAITLGSSAWVAIVGTCMLGAGIFLPFAPHITLSHTYLPQRVGAASGISIGVTSAIGGLMSAGLGYLADVQGLRIVFMVLGGALALGIANAFLMRDPSAAGRSPAPGRSALLVPAEAES